VINGKRQLAGRGETRTAADNRGAGRLEDAHGFIYFRVSVVMIREEDEPISLSEHRIKDPIVHRAGQGKTSNSSLLIQLGE
jgi:hypothetical protein